MGALPKQRISRARQGNRRRHHHLPELQLVRCRSCGEMKRSHHVCPSCGRYRGRQVVEIESTARATEQ